nr:hypothetical protein [Tanacetum cinerariifolium]
MTSCLGFIRFKALGFSFILTLSPKLYYRYKINKVERNDALKMVEDANENPNIVSSSLYSPLSKSFANILNDDKKSPKINFRSLFNEGRVEDADFVLPVKNVKVMRDDDDVFYFKLNLVTGLEQVMRQGPWMIRNQPLILTKWAPNLELSKDKVSKYLVWVKIPKVLVVAYCKDGLSLIVSQIRKPVMLYAFTSDMCNEPWGRIGYARALIEISANTDLKKVVSMAVPIIDGEGYTNESMVVEYEWKPPREKNQPNKASTSTSNLDENVTREDIMQLVKTKTAIDESQRYIYVDDEINMMKLKYSFDSLIEADKVLDTVQPDDAVSNDKNIFNDEDDDIEEVFLEEPRDEKWSNTIDVQKGASTPIIVVPNNDISGFRMYKVVKHLKLLKKPLRKLLDEQGNIFDIVKRLRLELDDVQLALDSDPSNYELCEEEAAYLNAFTEASRNGDCVVGDQVPTAFLDHYGVSWSTRDDKSLSPDGYSVAFFKEKNIGQPFLTQDLMHNYHLDRGPPRCAFKVDIQKAYDTVDWDFLRGVLTGFRFHTRMIGWIMECVTSTSFSISINGSLYGYSKGKKGLRQGYPMSPYLFTLVMKILTLMLHRKVHESDVFTYHRHCSKLNIINLCFADDLFLFAHGNAYFAYVIMDALEEFKFTSGLTPSLPKSMAYFCNVLNYVKIDIMGIFPFEEGKLPVKYLVVPLVPSRLVYRDCTELLKRDSMFILPSHLMLELEQSIRDFLWCQGDMRRGKAKILQARHLVRPFIWNRLGDGSKSSTWFDDWCHLSPLTNVISNRDIYEVGFNLLDKDLNAKEVEFSLAAVWNSIRPQSNEIRWHNLVWFPKNIPRHAIHAWLMLEGERHNRRVGFPLYVMVQLSVTCHPKDNGPPKYALAQSSGITTRPNLFVDKFGEESDDDAYVEILPITPIHPAVVTSISRNQGVGSTAPAAEGLSTQDSRGKGIMTNAVVASFRVANQPWSLSGAALSFKDIFGNAIHWDFFPFSFRPYYTTYHEGGVTANLNDKLASSDGAFAKDKAKGKERKKKIKSLTKNLDQLNVEVAYLFVALNQATDLEAKKDEEILRLKAFPLLDTRVSPPMEKDSTVTPVSSSLELPFNTIPSSSVAVLEQNEEWVNVMVDGMDNEMTDGVSNGNPGNVFVQALSTREKDNSLLPSSVAAEEAIVAPV